MEAETTTGVYFFERRNTFSPIRSLATFEFKKDSKLSKDRGLIVFNRQFSLSSQ